MYNLESFTKILLVLQRQGILRSPLMCPPLAVTPPGSLFQSFAFLRFSAFLDLICVVGAEL